MVKENFLRILFSIIILLLAYPLYSEEKNAPKIMLPEMPQRQDIVDLSLAQKIALKEAQKKFGEIVLREPIIGYSLNGSIAVYIFPFKIGGGMFPTDEEILKELDQAKQSLPAAEAKLAKIRHTILTERHDEVRFETKGDRAYVKKPVEWESAEQNVKNLENKCWGIGEYGTVIVSARKDLAPILDFSNGLPYYYTYRKIAEDKAKEALMTPAVSLTKYYFGSVFDQTFEFQASTGEKIWIVMFPLRVIKPNEIKTKRLQSTAEEKKWVEQKWNKMIEEVQNEK